MDTALHDVPPGYDIDESVVCESSQQKTLDTSQELDPFMIKVVEEALTDLAESKSKVSEERDDFNELVQEMDEHNASVKALEASEVKGKVRRGSKLLSRYVQYSVKKMKPMLDKIDQDRKQVTDKIEKLAQVCMICFNLYPSYSLNKLVFVQG